MYIYIYIHTYTLQLNIYVAFYDEQSMHIIGRPLALRVCRAKASRGATGEWIKICVYIYIYAYAYAYIYIYTHILIHSPVAPREALARHTRKASGRPMICMDCSS